MEGKRELQQDDAELTGFEERIEARADEVHVRGLRQRCQSLLGLRGGGRGAPVGAWFRGARLRRARGKHVVGEFLPELGGEKKARVRGAAFEPLARVVGADGGV